MIYQIQQLPPITQRALSVSSCLGHRLLLSTLQIALGGAQSELDQVLQPALNSGSLIQINDEVFFAHDRVQEAAYCLLSEEEKAYTHLSIGERLLSSNLDQNSFLFDIVAQFNRCIPLVTSLDERIKLAHLNLRAGLKAKQATAYLAALGYLYTVQKWINTKDLWETDYLLAFNFHKELVEIEYLIGHFGASEILIKDIMPHLRTPLDKIDILRLLITQETLQGHYKKAIKLGNQALKLLGASLPLGRLNEFIAEASVELKQKLWNISLSSLLDLPLIVNPEKQAIFKILGSIYFACYQTGIDLHSAVAFMSIKLALKYGHVPEICPSYAIYGYLLCTNFGEYALGYKFGELALQLARKLNSSMQYGKSLAIMLGYIYHWCNSIQPLPNLLATAYENSIACGDLEFAGYHGFLKVLTLFYRGSPLIKVQQETSILLKFAQNTKNQMAIQTIEALQRLLSNLQGDTANELSFDNNIVTDIQFKESCRQANNFYSLCIYAIFKAKAFYLYGHFEKAFEQLRVAKLHLTFIGGQYVTTAILNWHDSLTLLALYPTVSTKEQPVYLQKIAQNQQEMKKWERSCPENFAHKYALVQAEVASLKHDYDRAEFFYDKAIDLAGRHGFIHEQALAAELTAKYWLARGKILCSQGYLATAFNGYKQWGAKRKLMQFKMQHLDLLKALAPPGLSQLVINHETTLSGNTLKLLDLSSILKASYAISSEIELSKLLRKMMQIIIENTGAQQGTLLFVEGGDNLVVQAEYNSDGTITTLQNIPLSEWENGAKTVIQYVKRLQKTVIIDYAAIYEQFKYDPYISRTHAKSILCLPLLKRVELKAILYLENKLMTHAFTPERVQMLQILTAQISISLENARYMVRQIFLTRQLAEQSARAQTAEELLHVVKHDLQLALQASKAGTWNLWIDSNQITWDAANYALFGINPDTFKGTYEEFVEFVHPEDKEKLDQNVKCCIEQDIPLDVEYRIVWPDKSVHIISSQGRVCRDQRGQPIKMAGVSLDMTPRRQLEQERFKALEQAEEAQRQRAEDAERYAKDQRWFIDMVCHEIRNPMTGIYGNIDFIKQILATLKTFKEMLPAPSQSDLIGLLDDLKEITQTIEHCSKHQKNIIDNVLSLSKMEAGKVNLSIKPFQLNAFVKEDIIPLFNQRLKNESVVDFIIDLPKEKITIKGDVDNFKVILINFLSNAFKFTKKGYVKLSIRAETAYTNHITLIICVEDTGIGMTSEQQSCLFQKFSRSPSSQYEGSGLGLSISKKLIDLMKGRIQVKSIEGEGSCFTIYLTFETVNETKKIPLVHPEKFFVSLSPLSVTKHILVVEDNIVNQKLLRRQLELAGYKCTVADNGQKAVELIGALAENETIQKWNIPLFDIILMDLEMPVLGGIEATKLIRKKETELQVSSIPIVGLSAYTREDYIDTAKQAGMNDYSTKPYKKEELLNIIRSLTA